MNQIEIDIVKFVRIRSSSIYILKFQRYWKPFYFKKIQEEILYVIEELILQPATLCSMFIDDCGNPRMDTSSWNITLPPKRPGLKFKKKFRNSIN